MIQDLIQKKVEQPQTIWGRPTGDALSAREAEILRWIALGKTNPEIGSILGISSFTVKNHVQRILKKLDVINRTQAVGKVQAFFNYG